MSNKRPKPTNQHANNSTKETPKKDAAQKPPNPDELLPLSLTEQVGKKNTLDAILKHYSTWLPRYQEFAQGRSDFQIEKMIATEHATPAASYQHTLYQLRVMHQSLIGDFVRGIEQKRTFEYKWATADKEEPQWWEAGKDGKKLCWYDTDRLQHEHELEELKMSVKDKLLQLQTFTKILEAMETKHDGPYTRDQLNEEEPEYWKLRLARQMSDEYLDRQTGLGTGSLKSLRMAMADSPLPGSKNKVEGFPDLINAVLSGRESGLEALNAVNEELFGYMNTLTSHEPALADQKSAPTVAAPTAVKTPVVSHPVAKAPADSATEQAAALARLQAAGVGVSELED